MEQKKNKIYIGTSGWMYKDWGREFYPPDLKKEFLSYLAREFNTVEINTSFYHLPSSKTFKKWNEETPKEFIFSTKLSRYITHIEKLEGVRAPLDRFIKNAQGLKKLRIILIQLPPFLKFNEIIFKKFIDDLEKSVKKYSFRGRFALEPRNKSWIENSKKIKTLLKKHKIALVFPHSSKIPSFPATDKNITSDFVYVRFHGPSEFAASKYGTKRLAPWAKKIRSWHKKGLNVFVYFNNDVHGHAVHDARTLKTLCKI